MRASRLLQILLILQNRGRMSAARLARELEVVPRTILRDVDALTEAGLPIIVHQGHGGGIELGFDYRTRLTGLDADEAMAMGVLLDATPPVLHDLGLGPAADRARAKMREAFPDRTRRQMAAAVDLFGQSAKTRTQPDTRRPAMALAVREGRVVRLRSRSADSQTIHPAAMQIGEGDWTVTDALTGTSIAETNWGDVNISARRFR
jgi:predicted DNA-binding transcriptional regulator YafY